MTESKKKLSPNAGLFSVLDAAANTFQPSPLTGGPWNPSHQHGGAVAGLLTHAMLNIESTIPMRLVRMTIDMFRGVPLTPLRVETRVLRAGRRIQSVEANLFDGETQVARATGLQMRMDESLAVISTPERNEPALGKPPIKVKPFPRMKGFASPDGFITTIDMARDEEGEDGKPSNLWVRLLCGLMENQPIHPIERLAVLADFASGTGNHMDYTKYTAINPDLSIHIIREPRTDWVGIRGISRRTVDGIGQSQATIYDLEGPVANVQACLLIDRR